MTMPQLSFPGRGPLARVTAGIVAAMVVVGVLGMIADPVTAWLATPTGRGLGVGGAAQVWRPFTAALVTGSPISLVLAAIFTYWCGADLEAQLSPRRYGLVVAASALAAAVAAAWLLPAYGLIGTASSLAWGMIGAATLRAYLRGFNVSQQLLILGLLLLMSVSMGGMAWLVSVAALAAGAGAVAIMHYLPTTPVRRPRADDWTRRPRQQTGASRVDLALGGLCLALLLLWVLAQLF